MRRRSSDASKSTKQSPATTLSLRDGVLPSKQSPRRGDILFLSRERTEFTPPSGATESLPRVAGNLLHARRDSSLTTNARSHRPDVLREGDKRIVIY